jgi:hypothetical protein
MFKTKTPTEILNELKHLKAFIKTDDEIKDFPRTNKPLEIINYHEWKADQLTLEQKEPYTYTPEETNDGRLKSDALEEFNNRPLDVKVNDCLRKLDLIIKLLHRK